MYDIETEEFSNLFLQAWQIAALNVQEEMEKYNRIKFNFKTKSEIPPAEEMEKYTCRWIKAYPTTPSFEHFTFSCKNRIFCVLIKIQDGKGSASITPWHIKNLIETCEENNLTPCIYPLDVNDLENPDMETLSPVSPGWNLFDPMTHKPVNVLEIVSDEPVLMSKWEFHDLAIKIVRTHIEEKLKKKVFSFQNVLGLDPQIWFCDEDGKNKSWVIVRHSVYPAKEPEEKTTAELLETVKGNVNRRGNTVYQGYTAKVKFMASDDAEDKSRIYRSALITADFDDIEKA